MASMAVLRQAGVQAAKCRDTNGSLLRMVLQVEQAWQPGAQSAEHWEHWQKPGLVGLLVG